MALLKSLEALTPQELFDRLVEIDWLLNDMFISWSQTKKLLEESNKIKQRLQELGYIVF